MDHFNPLTNKLALHSTNFFLSSSQGLSASGLLHHPPYPSQWETANDSVPSLGAAPLSPQNVCCLQHMLCCHHGSRSTIQNHHWLSLPLLQLTSSYPISSPPTYHVTRLLPLNNIIGRRTLRGVSISVCLGLYMFIRSVHMSSWILLTSTCSNHDHFCLQTSSISSFIVCSLQIEGSQQRQGG